MLMYALHVFCNIQVKKWTYCIAGNFGEVFNLANWRFYGKSPNLKSAIFYSDVF